MKRSPFAKQWQPKPKEERVCAILKPIRVPEIQAAKLPMAMPKFEYICSPILMRAYGMLPCQHCGSETGSVGAHSNWSIHGKGRGIKASDVRAASLCVECHTRLDQGNDWTNEEKQQIWHDAHKKTVQKLVILKLWPLGVPVPNLDWPEEWT